MIRPWVFIKSGSCLFQVYDDGIDTNNGLYVSNLEYDLSTDNQIFGRLQNSNNLEYVRFGLGVPIHSLINSSYSRYISDSPKLLRQVFAVKDSEILEVIDLVKSAKDIVHKSARICSEVSADFLFLFDLLLKSGINVDSLGVEGSLLAGLTNQESDLDLVLYGENNYKIFLNFYNENNDWPISIEPFHSSEFGRQTIYNARKYYSPLSKKEMIFHESRKPTGFIKNAGIIRKFSIVGILDTEDSLRKEATEIFYLNQSFKFIDICTVRGIISSDKFSLFRPSFYGVDKCISIYLPERISNEKLSHIKYIVDYLGNFYLHCKINERFECRATIEEIIVDGKETGQYRLNLNHWDDHIRNGYYLKTIID